MGMPLSSWAMSENETKNLQIHTSGPLRLAILKRDPVPTKLLPARDAWTLLQPCSQRCTSDMNVLAVDTALSSVPAKAAPVGRGAGAKASERHAVTPKAGTRP